MTLESSWRLGGWWHAEESEVSPRRNETQEECIWLIRCAISSDSLPVALDLSSFLPKVLMPRHKMWHLSTHRGWYPAQKRRIFILRNDTRSSLRVLRHKAITCTSSRGNYLDRFRRWNFQGWSLEWQFCQVSCHGWNSTKSVFWKDVSLQLA